MRRLPPTWLEDSEHRPAPRSEALPAQWRQLEQPSSIVPPPSDSVTTRGKLGICSARSGRNDQRPHSNQYTLDATGHSRHPQTRDKYLSCRGFEVASSGRGRQSVLVKERRRFLLRSFGASTFAGTGYRIFSLACARRSSPHRGRVESARLSLVSALASCYDSPPPQTALLCLHLQTSCKMGRLTLPEGRVGRASGGGRPGRYAHARVTP